MVVKNAYNFKSKGLIYPNKCVDLYPLRPVSFYSTNDYLQIPGQRSFKNGKIEISFRTMKENCLLSFNPSEKQFHFHNLEIRESKLFLSAMYGSDVFGELISQVNVSNGEDHTVEIDFQEGSIVALTDGVKHILNFSTQSGSSELSSEWYLGSIPTHTVLSLPPQIWSGWLRQFFSGCIITMKINDELIQLDLLIKHNSSVKIGCANTKEIDSVNVCANKPCNEGVCQYDWDQIQCDCGDSNFTGPTCNREATVAEFNGYQFMKITLRNHYQSEAEDISLRFLSKLSDGLILSTDSQFSGTTDKLQIFMKNGNVYLLLNFGQGNKKFKTNENCFDGKWHTIKIRRRRKNLKMWIDGKLYHFNFQSHSDALSGDLLQLGRASSSKNELYVGYMMHFVFNGVNYFELAKNTAPINIEVTASLSQASQIKQFPIYFQSVESYLLLSKINIFGDFRLEFYVKTIQASGLVLLLKGESGDYLFLEMVDRLLHIVYNWGSGYKRKASENGPLNDNNWHSVKIIRHQSKTHSFAFRVDGIPEGDRADVPVEKGGLNFNHYGRMFLGGYAINESIVMFDNETPRSKNGFQGCIASFYVNNSLSTDDIIKYKDLLQEATKINGVQENCPNLNGNGYSQCSVDYCGYGGSCVQQWRGISCDCSMTSFTGLKCKEASTTVQFLRQPSYIIYKFIIPRNNTIDKLSFGFQTNTVKDSSLISIMSTTRQHEFMHMGIKILEGRGFVEVNYNLGGITYSFLESRLNVVDGFYHIVRFTRHGMKATLQIDNLSQRIYVPDAEESYHIIEHSMVILGSRVIENKYSFQGYISGVNLNNIPLMDIVKNHVEPNTQLINKSNIILVPSFVPRLSDRSSLSLRQSEEEVKSPKENPATNRLVIAKLNCPGVTEEEKNQCQFTNTKGLVKPGITYRKLDNNKDQEETFSSQTVAVLTTYHPIESDYGNRLSVSDTNNHQNINSPTRKIASDSVNINLWLIVAFSSAGAFLLVALSCLIYRCSTKDEGSYSVEEDRICIQTREKAIKLNLKPLREDKINEGLLSNGSNKNTKKKKVCSDVKEWYV